MAYIQIDTRLLHTAANQLDAYVAALKNKTAEANQIVEALSADWQGSDYILFQQQWEQLSKNGSIHALLIQYLENYADYLRFACETYENAQSHAQIEARHLPR